MSRANCLLIADCLGSGQRRWPQCWFCCRNSIQCTIILFACAVSCWLPPNANHMLIICWSLWKCMHWAQWSLMVPKFFCCIGQLAKHIHLFQLQTHLPPPPSPLPLPLDDSFLHATPMCRAVAPLSKLCGNAIVCAQMHFASAITSFLNSCNVLSFAFQIKTTTKTAKKINFTASSNHTMLMPSGRNVKGDRNWPAGHNNRPKTWLWPEWKTWKGRKATMAWQSPEKMAAIRIEDREWKFESRWHELHSKKMTTGGNKGKRRKSNKRPGVSCEKSNTVNTPLQQKPLTKKARNVKQNVHHWHKINHTAKNRNTERSTWHCLKCCSWKWYLRKQGKDERSTREKTRNVMLSVHHCHKNNCTIKARNAERSACHCHKQDWLTRNVHHLHHLPHFLGMRSVFKSPFWLLSTVKTAKCTCFASHFQLWL